MKNKHKREKDMKLDVLLSKDSSKAQGWIVEDGDDEDEVEPGSGLTWKMVEEAFEADEMLQLQKSARNVEYREHDEEDFDSDEEPKENDIEFESEDNSMSNLTNTSESQIRIIASSAALMIVLFTSGVPKRICLFFPKGLLE